MGTTLAGAEEVHLTVTYDGPAVEAGRMDARELAPAMLSTAKLFEHSAALIYGSGAALKIEVDADFRRGSFSYDIVTAAAVVLGTSLLQNMSVSDVVEAGRLLINTVKAARGRLPREIDRSGPEPRIVFHDGDNITVNAHVAQLFVNPTVRRDLDGVVEPLKREGVDQFRLSGPATPPTVIRKDEVDYFRAPDDADRVLYDQETREIVQVVAPDFRPGNKWQFTLAGGGHFWARIFDEEFLARVRRHEISFGSGDALRVVLRVRVMQTPTGEYDRLYEVVRVIDHITPQREPTLFDDAG